MVKSWLCRGTVVDGRGTVLGGGRDGWGTVVGPSGDGRGIVWRWSWLSRDLVVIESCDLRSKRLQVGSSRRWSWTVADGRGIVADGRGLVLALSWYRRTTVVLLSWYCRGNA